MKTKIELNEAEQKHVERAMRKLSKNYEKALNSPYVQKPLAWALFQTWKEYDEMEDKRYAKKAGDQS